MIGLVVLTHLTQVSADGLYPLSRALPQGAKVAASFVRGDEWYAMSSNEIECVNRLLARKPWFAPEGTDVISDLTLDNKIIMWARDGSKLVPADVVECNDKVTTLRSAKAGHWFRIGSIETGKPVVEEEARKPLLRLIERIKAGIEPPVAEERE